MVVCVRLLRTCGMREREIEEKNKREREREREKDRERDREKGTNNFILSILTGDFTTFHGIFTTILFHFREQESESESESERERERERECTLLN